MRCPVCKTGIMKTLKTSIVGLLGYFVTKKALLLSKQSKKGEKESPQNKVLSQKQRLSVKDINQIENNEITVNGRELSLKSLGSHVKQKTGHNLLLHYLIKLVLK